MKTRSFVTRRGTAHGVGTAARSVGRWWRWSAGCEAMAGARQRRRASTHLYDTRAPQTDAVRRMSSVPGSSGRPVPSALTQSLHRDRRRPSSVGPGHHHGAIGPARTGRRPPREGAGRRRGGGGTMVTPRRSADRAVRRTRCPTRASGSRGSAADIALVPGEYAAPQGGEQRSSPCSRAASRPVKLVDGIERVVGVRTPGEIFGEVPIALGTVFPVGFRAAEPSRVMRIEARDYHAVAAVVARGRAGGRRLAAHRMGGRAACRASRPSRPRRGRSSSGTAGTRRATNCAASSTATRSCSVGHARRAGRRASGGAARCRPRRTAGDPRRRRQDRRAPAVRRVAELLGLGTEPARPSTTP